jgi:adenosine deaminase CECR1
VSLLPQAAGIPDTYQYPDHAFRQKLSTVAVQANDIVANIRQYEIDNVWRQPAPLGEEDSEMFAGMMFPKARATILETDLWKVVSRMPKGSLLHAHLSAMQPADVMLQAVYDTEGMVISMSEALTNDIARDSAAITMRHVNTTTEAASAFFHEEEYVADTEIPFKQAAEAHPGGKDAFFAYLKYRLVLSPEESIRHDLGVDAIWRTFEALFGVSGNFLGYEPLLRTYYRNLLSGLVDDNISWVEIRHGWSPGLVPEGQEEDSPDLDFFWRVTTEEIARFQATEKGKDFWGVRFIWADLRGLNRTLIANNMVNALEMKLAFPELISGYDLVQQEDLGAPLIELAPELIFFQEQASALNVTMPFFFHAGETLGDGNATDNNLFDALLFDSRRIGHGFSLYKHPQLLKDAIANHVMVEVCPISSEVLRLATDILHHPITAMINHGVATAISNDDASMMGQDAPGLSFDFYQVLQASDNLGLAGLGALAENSVRWSNFEDQVHLEWVTDIEAGVDGSGIKAQRLQQWHEQWESFCQWIVDEFGEQYS